MTRLVHGGLAIQSLKRRPGRLFRLNSSPKRTWAAWDFDPKSGVGKVAGVLAFVHMASLPGRNSLPLLVSRCQDRDLKPGFWDPAFPENSFIPGNEADRQAIIRDVPELRNPLGVSIDGEKHLQVFPGPEGTLFIGVSKPVGPRAGFPGKCVLALVIAGVTAFLGSRNWRSVRLSVLLVLLVLISGGIPFFIMTGFWKFFEENRRANLTSRRLEELSHRLIKIDQAFPAFLGKKKAEYRACFRKVMENPSRLGELVSDLESLEWNGEFDTVALVGSQGEFLRDFSEMSMEIRRLALMPASKREKLFEAFVGQGLSIIPSEYKFISSFGSRRGSKQEFIGFKPAEDGKYVVDLTRQIVKDLLRAYDEQNGVSRPGTEEESVSSMLIGTFMDEEGGIDIIRTMASLLGDLVFIGTGKQLTVTFVDIIPDDRGAGEIAGIIFHNLETLERLFLERFFSAKENIPPGMQILALTNHKVLPSFPRLESARFFGDCLRRVQPPDPVWTGIVGSGKDAALMACLGCKNLPHYVLVATQPLTVVIQELSMLRTRLLLLGIALFVMLSVQSWRLFAGLWKPSQDLLAGIMAMERKELEYRIPLETNDEWDLLASRFNLTLAGMGDLEVARVVQKNLLPGGPVDSGKVRFSAVNIMCDEVGGDYHDSFLFPDGRLFFIFGDVSGHSVSAALVVAMAKAGFGFLVRGGVESPGEMLTRLNDLFLKQLKKVKMMTCFAGCLSPSGLLRFCNAGQTYPFLVSPGEDVATLKQVGSPLGVSMKRKFLDQEIHVAPGSRIFLYTDGIVEAGNQAGQPFGFQRIQDSLTAFPGGTDQQLFRFVEARLRAFSGPVPWKDDVTMALVELS